MKLNFRNLNDSDKRVKELKGDDRPFHSEEERKYNLERINGVSKVIIFDSEIMLEEAIKRYQPDIFVIGSDYKDKSIVGEKYSKSTQLYIVSTFFNHGAFLLISI